MLSNFKFRYNASFTAEEKERNKQKMEERLKLEKDAEQNKQKMEERLKLEKQFREEAERIKKQMIHNQYQNKLKERLKLEKERNKQKMEERLKLEKQFREEAEQIKKQMIHNQYQNKLKEILTKDIILLKTTEIVKFYGGIKEAGEYVALENLISLKIEELDKFLRIKGLRFPYNDLDIYLKNPEFLCKAMEFKKQIEKLNDDLHEKRILRQKIRDEVFYGII